MNIRTHIRPALLAAALLLPAAAMADTTTANLNVTLTITSGCTIDAATLDFGTRAGGTGSIALPGQTPLSVTCTSGTAYQVGFGNGANYTTTRRMADGSGNFFEYELYTNNTYGTVLDDTTNFLSGTGTQPQTLHGQVFANQTKPTGTYTDTVVMTVTY